MGKAVSLLSANNLQPPLRRWLEEPTYIAHWHHGTLASSTATRVPYRKITLSRSTSSTNFPNIPPGKADFIFVRWQLP